MSKLITRPQTRHLRALSRSVFPSDDLYHDWLLQQFGKVSTKQLTRRDASMAIRLLKGDTSDRAYPIGSGVAAHLTDRQARKIGALIAERGISGAGLDRIIKRQTGQDKGVEMLTRSEATKVIILLERMAGDA